MNWEEYNKHFPVEKVLIFPEKYFKIFNDRYDAEKFLIDLMLDEYRTESTVVEFNNKFYVVPSCK